MKHVQIYIWVFRLNTLNNSYTQIYTICFNNWIYYLKKWYFSLSRFLVSLFSPMDTKHTCMRQMNDHFYCLFNDFLNSSIWYINQLCVHFWYQSIFMHNRQYRPEHDTNGCMRIQKCVNKLSSVTNQHIYLCIKFVPFKRNWPSIIDYHRIYHK